MSPVAIEVRGFSQSFGDVRKVFDLDLDVVRNEILGIIGPARSGKSTFLCALNRLNDLVRGSRHEGTIRLDGRDIYGPEVDVVELRRKLGMVFATPVPLPRSIFENVAFGARMAGIRGRDELEALVRDSLEKSGLWEEVRDRLGTSGLKLSGGQQQRLCVARILAVKPEFILLDEPTSGLDPISARAFDTLIRLLADSLGLTVFLVTHDLDTLFSIIDRVIVLSDGRVLGSGTVAELKHIDDPWLNDYFAARAPERETAHGN